MAAARRSQLPLGHKPVGYQRARRIGGHRTVPPNAQDHRGYNGRRAYSAPPSLRNPQFQPTSPRFGDRALFNVLGRPSF